MTGVSSDALRRLRERQTRAAAIARRPSGVLAPASLQQEALWFLDQMLGPGTNSAYNVNSVLHLSGPLDAAALSRALTEALARHEVLRSHFDLDGDRLVLKVNPAEPVTLRADPADPARLDALLLEHANRPYDLAAGPLWRARLLCTGPQQHVLGLGFHHSVFDGWSLGVLYRELSALYGGATLEPLPLQYGDYAAWQREMLAGPQAERQLGYWRQRLAGAPEFLALPADRPRPDSDAPAGAEYHTRLPGGLSGPLRERARVSRVSLYMLLLAAYQLLLARLSGATDICVGAVVPGRSRPELEGLAGYFVNTVVLRCDLSGAPSFDELLARTRDTVLGAHEHQDVPFARVVQGVAPRRSLAHGTLYQVMFLLQELSDDRLHLPGLDLRLAEAPAVQAKCDLTLAMWEDSEGYAVAFEYATELFDRETVAGFAEQLIQILQRIAAGMEP